MSATESPSKYSAKKRILYGLTTGGLLLGGIGMATAQADTSATGATADSPGVASGNLINIPINLPINLCGDTLNVVGLLDPAADNSCSNESGSDSGSSTTATGKAVGSPGIGSGNLINIPINAPVNVCGDSVSVVGVGNSAHDNTCGNEGPGTGATPPGCGCTPPPPPPCGCAPSTPTTPTGSTQPTGGVQPTGELASTGSGAMAVAPLGLGLLGGGTFLNRRGAQKSRAQ